MSLPRRLALPILVCLLVGACSTPEASPGGNRTAIPERSSTERAAATASASASPVAASPAPTVAPNPPPIALEPVASGLVDPISIAAAPGGWLLVNEQAGRVVAVEPATGRTEVAVDLRDRVLGQGERGLLALSLHPAWPEDERAFVHYSDRDGDTVLSELTSADPDSPFPVLDPASERVLLALDQPFSNHNGGQLAFGPDGMLWFGLGDGGSGGDPLGNGQNPGTLLGTILRLDVATPGAVAAAPDNAFADGRGAPEVHLYGLRNPWRFSFDRATGELWIADVGQNAYEEVNRLDPVADAGANLGWPIMEASHCFADPACSSEGLLVPIVEYGRDAGCSITGGYVYRGDAISGLAGWYLFSDYCSGTIFGIPSDAEPPAEGSALAPRILLETGARVTSFGEASDGELYLADLASGTAYRVVGG